jgi:hypothetical protein
MNRSYLPRNAQVGHDMVIWEGSSGVVFGERLLGQREGRSIRFRRLAGLDGTFLDH